VTWGDKKVVIIYKWREFPRETVDLTIKMWKILGKYRENGGNNIVENHL